MPAYQRWHHHFIAGLVTVDDPVQLDTICPQGVAYIDDWIGPLQVILSFLTLSIWTPTTVTIYCRADGAPPVPVQVPFAPPPQVLEDLRREIPDLEERVAAAIEVERESVRAEAITATTRGSGRL
jgi:hypothetical protein